MRTNTGGRVVEFLGAGNAATAGRRLYAALRRLDGTGCTTILAQLFPPGPGAEAINDRLRKAAARPVQVPVDHSLLPRFP
jgi:hypothetical protein